MLHTLFYNGAASRVPISLMLGRNPLQLSLDMVKVKKAFVFGDENSIRVTDDYGQGETKSSIFTQN